MKQLLIPRLACPHFSLECKEICDFNITKVHFPNSGFLPCCQLQHMGLLWGCIEAILAPNSSTLAWRIPWTEEPGGLQSIGLHRVGHDWVTSLSLFTFMHWRRKWQPTPVFLPGESQGRGSLYKHLQYSNAHIDYLFLQTSEGNGTPLEYSCLENPVDGAAW